MNGVMLHHELRRVDSELAERTLFISGRAQSADDLDYFSSAASGFLSKPFEVADVLREVFKLLTVTP
jgi:CheY-like chemotaxis protein